MNTKFKIALAIVAGTAFGAAAMQGLYAQAKPKAYSVTETEAIDNAALATYVPAVQAAIKAAGGRVFNTAGGKVVAIVGGARKRVAINEWDSLEKLQVFYSSKAWTDLAPQRDKAVKTIRLFAVEAAN
jgi:uncharacterized protein (DUF1330 family)